MHIIPFTWQTLNATEAIHRHVLRWTQIKMSSDQWPNDILSHQATLAIETLYLMAMVFVFFAEDVDEDGVS